MIGRTWQGPWLVSIGVGEELTRLVLLWNSWNQKW